MYELDLWNEYQLSFKIHGWKSQMFLGKFQGKKILDTQKWIWKGTISKKKKVAFSILLKKCIFFNP